MANQVTVYKGDAAFGSYSTINEALTAINAQAGDYKIALNGTFTEAVHLSDWDGVNITFVKAEGAETAAITGEVIVGNATSPNHKGTQYAWNGNLRFEGITFDYTEATANTTRFEIRYIGTANTLDIVDCAFKGPGMINAGYNGGQPTNNNGDPNGDNGGNLLCTPWAAATDGVQGKLTVTGTTFTDGNINFWRNSADWSFTNCDFIDAPVTILGNPVRDSYDFINCDFSLTESKAGIASYLLGATDNSGGIKVVGGTMEVAEGVNAPCILSDSPNGSGPKSKAMITIDGTAVTIPENSKFIVTESYAETTNQPGGDNSYYGVMSGTNVTGVTPDSLKNAENAVIITTDANGAITEVIADSGNGEYKVYDGEDMNVEVFSKSGVVNYATFAEAMQKVDSTTYAVIVRDGQAADLYSSVSTTNPAGLLIDMGNHGITVDENLALVDSDGNLAEGSDCSTVYSTNYGAGVTVKADILANFGTTTVNGTVQVNGVLSQGGEIIVNGSLIVAGGLGVSCADVMLTVNGTLSAGKIYHNDNTAPGKIVIGKDGVATVDDLVLEKEKGAVVEVAGDLVVTNSAETKKLTVAEGGSVTIDAADTFDVAEIAGAGDLVINVAQGFEGAQQILAAGTTAGFTGEVKVAGLEGVNVIKTADGAYGLSKADMSTFYVSSDYASYKNFDEISESLFKNVNAFATTKEAYMAARNVGGEITIDLTGAGSETLDGTVGFGNAGKNGFYTITGGSMATTSYGISFANTNTTVKFDNATFKVGKIYVENAGGSLIVNNSVIGSAYYSGHNSGWVTAGQGSISITDSIFGMNFANYTAEQVAAMPRSASEVKEAVEAGTYEYWKFGANNSGPHMGTAGAINVKDSTLSTSWISLIDRGEMALDNSVLYYGGAISIGAGQVDNSYGSYNSNEIGWDAQIWWNPVLSSAAGFREGKAAALTIKDSIVRNIGNGNGDSGAHVQVGGSFVNGIDSSITGECAGVLDLINSEFYTTPYDADGNAMERKYDMIVVKSNGTVNVTDSKLVSAKVINEGTFTVSGDSSIQAGSFTGLAQVTGGTLTDSSLVGGTVAFTGDTTLEGTNNMTWIWVSGGTLTVNGTLTTTSPYPGFFAIGDNTQVNAGEQNNYFKGFTGTEAGKLVVNGTYTAEEGVVSNGGELVVNGTMTASCVYFRGGSTTINEGASLSGMTWGDIAAGATLTVNKGSFNKTSNIDGQGGGMTNAGTITVNDGIFSVAAGMINDGVFNINYETTLPTITVGNMTNNGTINVTVTGEAAEGYKGGLLIDDADGAGSDYGTVNITVEGQSKFETLVVDGDLHAVNKGTIYVNYAWATDTLVGTEVGDGMYYGINAFSSLETITTELTVGPCTVYFDYAKADVAGLVVSVNGETTITNYTFDNTAYSVLNAQTREHDIELVWSEKNSQYEFSGAFNFTSGDFSFEEIKTIVKNPETPEDVTGSGVMADGGELVQVGGVSGDKSYTFTLDAISDFDYIISGIEGTGRLTLTNTTTGEVITRLFGNNGTYTLSELDAGTYTATFGGYGLINDEAEFNVEFEFAEIAVEVLNDERANATQIDAGSTTLIENKIGQETASDDIVDWFAITGMTPAADGTLVMDFAVEGDGRGSQIIVNVYKVAAGDTTLQTIGGFVVNDTVDTGFDRTQKFYGVSATDTIYVQVFGYGQSDYSINLAQPTSL